jgi:general secretion pathway protein I
MKSIQYGFTLIEIMIALAVIAIALGAIFNTVGSSVSQAAYIQDKTLGHWVAQNTVSELLLTENWRDPQEKTGITQMSNRQWYWKMKIIQTPNENIRRIEITVFMDSLYEEKISTLNRYISRSFKLEEKYDAFKEEK